MLAKKHRLTRREFTGYFKSGKRINHPHATIVVSPHPSFHGAVVVSKKVSKKAPRRNTLRRRVYAQLYRALKKQQTGVFIVILKPSFNQLSRQEQHNVARELIELTT